MIAPVGAEMAAEMDVAEVSLTEAQRANLRIQLEGVDAAFAMGTILEPMAAIVDKFFIKEVCCSRNSELNSACLRLRMQAQRKSIENVEKKETIDVLINDYNIEKPTRAWFSPRCTEWSNIQSLI